MSVKQELCDTDADGFEDSIVSGYRSPAAGKVAVCDVVTEPPVDTPIPVLGPSNLTNEVVAPALGPVDVASDLAPAYSGPYNLSASVVAPALGPSIVQSSIAVSSAGPSNISASIAAPALGPTNLAEVTGVSELTQRETLFGDVAGKWWGRSLAVNQNGDRMIVGVSSRAPSNRGGAHVYELQESGWVQMGNGISGPINYGYMGQSVDMSDAGDRVIVGGRAGQVQIYDWNGSDWVLNSTISSSDAERKYFGELCIINGAGNFIAIGDWYNPANSDRTGELHLYEWDGSAWVQKGSVIVGAHDEERVGSNFDINENGDKLILERKQFSPTRSQYEVYEWDGSDWVLGQTLDITFESMVSMSKSGNRIALYNSSYNDYRGRTFVYEFDGSTWGVMGSQIEVPGLKSWDRMPYAKITFNDAGDRIFMHTSAFEDENGENIGLAAAYAWDGTDWRLMHDINTMTGAPYLGYNHAWGSRGTMSGSGIKVFVAASYFRNTSGTQVGKIDSYELPSTLPKLAPMFGPTNLEAPKPVAGPQNLLAGEAPVLGPTNMLGEMFTNYVLFTTWEDRIYGCNTWLPNWFDPSIIVISQTPGRQRFAVPVGTSPQIGYRKWGSDGLYMNWTSEKYARWVALGSSYSGGGFYYISHDRFHLNEESPLWIYRDDYEYWGLTRVNHSERRYTIMTDIEGTVGYSDDDYTPIENFYASSIEIEEAIANGTTTSLNYLEARVNDIYIGNQAFTSSVSDYQYPNYCDTSIFEG